MFFIEGFFIGLTTLFLIGPVVFILINATVKNGLKSGFAVAIGIFISDLAYAILSLNGLSYILKNSFLDKYLSIIGFILLIGFGISYLLKKESSVADNVKNNNKTIIQNFISGFSINFFNPFVLSFWVLFSKYGAEKYPDKVNYFIIAIVIGILVIDIIKVFLSKKLTTFLYSKKVFLFYKIVGIVFVIFSLRLLFHYFSL